MLRPEDFDEADALKDSEGMRGDNRGDRLGSSIAAGDVDGDGRAELLVCAPGWTDALVAQGACILTNPAADDEMEFEGLRGGGQPLLMGATTNAEIGESAALLADLDGDGRAEILVGSPGEGEVSLWWGGEIPLLGSTEDAALHIDGGEGTGTELFATPDALWVMTRDGIREFVDLPASGTVSATTGERLHFPRAHRPGEGRTTYGGGANPGLFFGFPEKTIGVHGYPVDTP